MQPKPGAEAIGLQYDPEWQVDVGAAVAEAGGWGNGKRLTLFAVAVFQRESMNISHWGGFTQSDPGADIRIIRRRGGWLITSQLLGAQLSHSIGQEFAFIGQSTQNFMKAQQSHYIGK